MGGRGSCRAETYRQIVKSANRQVGKRQRVANSEWRTENDFDHPPEVGG